jgi:hypothetical protein
MPKNKGKGGKNRRRGKNENDDVKRELVQKEEGQGKKILNKFHFYHLILHKLFLK